ncbi:hypothetical protein [Reichenbachiella sp.]
MKAGLFLEVAQVREDTNPNSRNDSAFNKEMGLMGNTITSVAQV